MACGFDVPQAIEYGNVGFILVSVGDLSAMYLLEFIRRIIIDYRT